MKHQDERSMRETNVRKLLKNDLQQTKISAATEEKELNSLTEFNWVPKLKIKTLILFKISII